MDVDEKDERGDEAENGAETDKTTRSVSFRLQMKQTFYSDDETTPGSSTELNTAHRTTSLSFTRFPRTGLELKHEIERVLKVPVCVQTLYFSSIPVSNTQSLQRLRLRDQDTLTLEYLSHAEIGIINDILTLMREITELLDRVLEYYGEHSGENGLSPELDSEVQSVVDAQTVESLIFKFSPSKRPLSKSNRLYFIHNQGIQLTTRLHHQLLELPWSKLTIEMQYLEHALLRILWDLSSTIGVRYVILGFNVLEQASISLMRGEITPHEYVMPPQLQCAAQHANSVTQRYILGETMYKAMGIVTNLAELQECRAHIVQCPGLLKQMMSAILSPTYTAICADIVLSALLCLSYSTELHEHLAVPYVIDSVLEACERFTKELQEAESDEGNNTDYNDILLIKYFSMMFFALLVTGSPTLIPVTYPQILNKVDSFIAEFVNSTLCEEVHDAEVKTNYFWSTLKPIVKITYFHYEMYSRHPLTSEHPSLRGLYLHCMMAGVFSLGNMWFMDNFKTILIKEGLTDFILCLRWTLPRDVMADVGDIVHHLQSSVTQTAPKLSNLIRAQLAATSLSLDEVLGHEFVIDLCSRKNKRVSMQD